MKKRNEYYIYRFDMNVGGEERERECETEIVTFRLL
jgi:hypothetical protein